MVNPRRSTKPVLSLEKVTKPFEGVFTEPNDGQPGIGPCVTLQINNNKVSYPLNKPIQLPPEFYELLKDTERAGRNFMPPDYGNYDIDSEFKKYEPKIS